METQALAEPQYGALLSRSTSPNGGTAEKSMQCWAPFQALQCLFLSLVWLLRLCNTQRTSLGCLDNWNHEAQRLKQNQWSDVPFDVSNKSTLIRICYLLFPLTFPAPDQLSHVFVLRYLHHDPDLKANRLCSTSPYLLYLYNQGVFPVSFIPNFVLLLVLWQSESTTIHLPSYF